VQAQGDASSGGGDDVVEVRSAVSNNGAQEVAQVTLQVAASRAYTLRLQPQSAVTLAPHQRDGITQVIHVHGVAPGQGSAVRMKWKVGFVVGGTRTEESGGVDGIPGEI